MDRDELHQLIIDTIRDEVRIEVSHEIEFCSDYYIVNLMLCGECISSDTFYIK